MLQPLRQRLHDIFTVSDRRDPLTLIDNYGVLVLIAIDVAALILESFDELGKPYALGFRLIERVVVGLFTLEYGLRLWCCVEDPRYVAPLRGRLRYMGTSFALVDLAAFLPFYALNLIPTDWAEIVGPFFRLLRLLKLTRYSESTQIFFRVLRDKRDELLTTLFVVMTLLVIASSLMYFIEREAQPQEFSSIPAAMWWGVITLTTVGYGDVHPITPLGKLLSAILAFLGIGVFALPARDLAAAFSEEMRARHWGRGDRSSRALIANVQDHDGVATANGVATAIATPALRKAEAAADVMQLCVAAATQNKPSTMTSEAPRREETATMVDKLKPVGLSLASLRQYVQLQIKESRPYPWLDVSSIVLSETETTRLKFIQDDLRYRQVQLMNEATVWSRAIYPLLMLAEAGSIHAYSGIALQAAFPNFEIDVIADGVLGEESSGTVEAPFLVVVEAKRGIEGQNPLTQLYLEVLAAAYLNWQADGNPTQTIFGCYTVADVWTFLKAEVSEFDAPKPTLKVEFSRELFEKSEAAEICKILKKIVQQHPRAWVAA